MRSDTAAGPFFGTDGIRDAAGKGRLSPDNVRRIGRALAQFARARVAHSPRVFVGRDPRPSGVALLAEIAEGMAAEGVGIEDGGILPTPAIAWWTATGGCDVGIALTASHNPVGDNGIKVFLPGGRKTLVAEEQEIEALIGRAEPRAGVATPRPRPEAVERYVEAAVTRLLGGGRLDGIRLVLDCANGATQRTAPPILAALGAQVLAPVGSRSDGAINDHCGTQHPEAWIAAVRAARPAVYGGLAFDGDGDRVLLGDETGAILDGDDVLYLLATDLLERDALPGRRVVATVMSNFGLESALTRKGIALDRVAVGDRNVADFMRSTGAAVGAEQSGHVLLWWDTKGASGSAGPALVGDGVIAGVAAIQAARRRGASLSRCRADVPRSPQVLRNVRVARRVPLEAAPEFSAAVRREEDALRGRGRVVVRYSGTELLLRIMVEGPDEPTVAAAVARLERAAESLRCGLR